MLCQKSMPSWSRIMQIDQKEYDFFVNFHNFIKNIDRYCRQFYNKNSVK